MLADEPLEKSIFLRAVEIPAADQRAAYLDEACSGNQPLRAQVEALLAAHAQPLHLLDAASQPAGTIAYSVNEQTGARIGPYKLLQQIGEGGMGTVYMAEQTEPVARRVALKIIKPGMDSRSVIARFEAERQALALMDHPNIAKVLDAGTTDSGRPYFVMELVRGVPITTYCDERHLTPKERLELFVSVCQAVQHAHQKGIIHRDLKPSNVLIALYDSKPVAKIIDFGVAKATGAKLTERTLFTEFGQVIGTLEYMSPEQAELNQLDIDTRSDVYSLGVLLYELLTGTTPLDRKRLKETAFHEMLRIIREDEPQKPSTRLSTTDELPGIAASRGLEPKKLSGVVRGELDWLVMKCLEKERNRRYETANDLATDIQRFLADETVLACPPSVAYRLRKFARRNRAALFAATLVVAALLAGTVVSAWQAVVASRAHRDALAAADAERDAKAVAEARAAESKAVLGFVEQNIFAAARPQGVEGGLGREVSLRQAIDAALPFVETSFQDQPLIEAKLRMTIGLSYHLLGEHKIAQNQFQKSHALFLKHRGPDDPDTLWSMHLLAASQLALGLHSEALKLSELALARRKATLGLDHPDTLWSMHLLAAVYSILGQHTDALKLHEETLARRRATLGPDHRDTMATMVNLAQNYRHLGRYADALRLDEETLALQRAKHGSDHPYTLWSMHSVAESYSVLGRYADALKLTEQTLAIRKAKLGPQHPDTLATVDSLAEIYYRLNRRLDALKLVEETLAFRKGKLGADHPLTLRSMTHLAHIFYALGRNADAVKLTEESLAIQKARLGPDHPDTLDSLNNLATGYFLLGRHTDSLKVYEETLPVAKAKFGPDHPHLLRCVHNMANNYAALGRRVDAVKLYEEILPLAKAKLGAGHPHTIKTMNNLATNYATLKRHPEAIKVFEQALAFEKLRPEHPDTIWSMVGLSRSYRDLGRHEEAVKLREKALALQKKTFGVDHSDTLGSMNSLANSYETLGRPADAEKLRKERAALLEAKRGPLDPATIVRRAVEQAKGALESISKPDLEKSLEKKQEDETPKADK